MSLFLWGAHEQSLYVNTDMSAGDQGAYLGYAKTLKISDYHFVGARNRMPGYPVLLSFFYRPYMSDQAFFEVGKKVNTVVALLVLFVSYLVLSHFMQSIFRLLTILVLSFTVFVYKAAYFLF